MRSVPTVLSILAGERSALLKHRSHSWASAKRQRAGWRKTSSLPIDNNYFFVDQPRLGSSPILTLFT